VSGCYCGNRHLKNSPLPTSANSLSYQHDLLGPQLRSIAAPTLFPTLPFPHDLCTWTFSFPPAHGPHVLSPTVLRPCMLLFPHWGFLMPITRCLLYGLFCATCCCMSDMLLRLHIYYFKRAHLQMRTHVEKKCAHVQRMCTC
jgi:hypothetical protein